MRFRFDYAIKPSVITRKWGVYNKDYEQFFPGGLHNGVDFEIGADKTIYAPLAGTIIRIGNQPTGGGIFCGLLSDIAYDFDDGKTCFVLMDFLHCDHLLVKEGDHVEEGQALAIQDNTGFSTGPHTHIQFRRENKVPAPVGSVNSYRLLDGSIWLQDVDNDNVANGSFDPMPYASELYAQDIKTAAKLALDAGQIAQNVVLSSISEPQKITFLSELVEILKGLIFFWKK